MTFLSTYLPHPGNTGPGTGDGAPRSAGSATINDGQGQSLIGRISGIAEKDCVVTRYALREPVIGPPLDEARSNILGIRVTFVCGTILALQGGFGLWQAGLMDPSPHFSNQNNPEWEWQDPDFTFARVPWLFKTWLPWPTDLSDVYQAGTLYNDAFLTRTANWAFFAGSFDFNDIVEFGEGTLSRIDDRYETTNFISELTSYIRSHSYQTQPAIGIVVDAIGLPSGNEYFSTIMSGNATPASGMKLEIEWELLPPSAVHAGGFARERVTAMNFARERVTAKNFARERVRAPGSFAKSGDR